MQIVELIMSDDLVGDTWIAARSEGLTVNEFIRKTIMNHIYQDLQIHKQGSAV